MIRIDMSEYMEKHSVARLTGPPPGYIGFEEGGQLTEAVRRAPHSVVLLDEMEKAHSDVLNVLLQIMEDGILTDGKGRTVNFKNTILIMTSNVGSQRIMELSKVEAAFEQITRMDQEEEEDDDDDTVNGNAKSKDEFQDEAADALYETLSKVVKEELESTLKPELLNRIDEIVVFSPLRPSDLKMIANLNLDRTIQRARKEQSMDITVGSGLVDIVMREGSSNAAQFGARPMRRAAQRFFEDAISDAIVRGFLKAGDAAVVDLVAGREHPRHYTVSIKRSIDSKVLEVPVEKVSGGIGSSSLLAEGSSSSKKSSWMATTSSTLDTEPVP